MCESERETLPVPFDNASWPRGEMRILRPSEVERDIITTVAELRIADKPGVLVDHRGCFSALIIPLPPGTEGNVLKRTLASGAIPLPSQQPADSQRPGLDIDEVIARLVAERPLMDALRQVESGAIDQEWSTIDHATNTENE